MAYESWSYKRKVKLDTTSSGANVSGNVSNFAVLVPLDSSNFNFSQADPNGADIRFADSDGTELSYEVERWDSVNQKAIIWVRVPQVDGNSDQDYIYMHWGKSAETSESSGPNTFQSGNSFQAVWHLNEDPSGGAQAVSSTASTATATTAPQAAWILRSLLTAESANALISTAPTTR